jgi:hypothetical protein
MRGMTDAKECTCFLQRHTVDGDGVPSDGLEAKSVVLWGLEGFCTSLA